MEDTLGFIVLRVFLAICALSLFVVWLSCAFSVPTWLTTLNKMLIIVFYPILAPLLAWIGVVIKQGPDNIGGTGSFLMVRGMLGITAVSLIIVWLSQIMVLSLWLTVLNTIWIFPIYGIVAIRLAHIALAWKPKPAADVDTWFLT
jgi:hypothetical protein